MVEAPLDLPAPLELLRTVEQPAHAEDGHGCHEHEEHVGEHKPAVVKPLWQEEDWRRAREASRRGHIKGNGEVEDRGGLQSIPPQPTRRLPAEPTKDLRIARTVCVTPIVFLCPLAASCLGVAGAVRSICAIESTDAAKAE